MPTITIEGPPIKDLDKKRKLVKGLTDSAVEAYGLSKDKIVVLIKENQAENVGIGGQLLVDK
jgi:4-oxalocrotonate tautomerase